MMINEILQWGALAVLAVFVFGLLRQLGQFVVSPQEQLTAQLGPSEGGTLPREISTDASTAQFVERVRAARNRLGAVLVVSSGCPACDEALQALLEADSAQRMPLLVIARTPTAEQLAVARRVTDLVLEDHDGSRCAAAKLSGTPFLMTVDDELHVVSKHLGSDLDGRLDSPRPPSHNGAAGSSPLSSADAR